MGGGGGGGGVQPNCAIFAAIDGVILKKKILKKPTSGGGSKREGGKPPDPPPYPPISKSHACVTTEHQQGVQCVSSGRRSDVCSLVLECSDICGRAAGIRDNKTSGFLILNFYVNQSLRCKKKMTKLVQFDSRVLGSGRTTKKKGLAAGTRSNYYVEL